MQFIPKPNPDWSGILAIDTSTEIASIALATANGAFYHSWPTHRTQTTTVLPEVDRMAQQAGVQPSDISGVIVALGPGTFTGLRVGMAIAKGIVAAQGIPIVGIPTLDIVFASHPAQNVVAVLPAGRGRVVWQRRDRASQNSTVKELIAVMALMPELDLVGELTSEQEDEVREAGVRIVNTNRDPLTLLSLGAARILAGGVDDAVTLEPTYLHGVTVNAGPIQDLLTKK